MGLALRAAVIDLHCHILPGIDDGAAEIGDSVAMARAAAEEGVSLMVATPHVNGRYMPRAAEIAERVREVNAALAEEHVAVVVSPGAEIGISELSLLDEAELRGLALGGSTTLLVESPYSAAAPFLEGIIFDAQAAGYRVLLAHPERSPVFQRDLARLEALIGRGVLVSLSAGSLSSGDRTSGRLARELISRGLAHNVASDAHDAKRRPPRLAGPIAEAAKRIHGLAEHREWLTSQVPAALLSDEPLPAPPRVRLAERRRFAWRR